MSLYSDNLVLRQFELADAKRVRELAGDYDIAKTTLHIPHPYPEDSAEAWIKRTHEAAKKGSLYAFAMVRKLDGQLLGAISLGIVPEYQRAELAYWMGKPYWRQGHTTEAASRLLKFGFDELDLNRIYAFAFSTNSASSRVMQKIGMTYEGTLVQHVRKWDQYYDLVAYGILKQTYQELAT
ncbi:MAG: GNAT family N-acetyltransferase [Firmicutes bacterium]|nr:GNAT family N-acetyltransferase [Bacillota bacterium]